MPAAGRAVKTAYYCIVVAQVMSKAASTGRESFRAAEVACHNLSKGLFVHGRRLQAYPIRVSHQMSDWTKLSIHQSASELYRMLGTGALRRSLCTNASMLRTAHETKSSCLVSDETTLSRESVKFESKGGRRHRDHETSPQTVCGGMARV